MKLLTSFVKLATIRKNIILPNAKTISYVHQTAMSSSTGLSYRTAMSSLSAESTNDSQHQENISQSDTAGRGSLLTLLLPKDWRDFNVNKDDSNRVDPATFENSFDTTSTTARGMNINSVQDDESNITFNFDTVVEIGKFDPADLIVSLDLDLYLKEEEGTCTHVHMNMNRDAMERSNRTFKRLELSVAKKITSILAPSQNKGKGKASNKKRKKGGVAGVTPTSRLFTRDANAGDGDDKVHDINTEEYAAMELCKKLALQHDLEDYTAASIGLELSIPNENVPVHVDPDVPQTSNSTNIELCVIANPPMILSVQTFESFSSKLFVKVPVVIQTTLLHATRAEVSWFVDNDLVLRNSHSFIPLSHHVGKTLSVVISPYRKGYHGKCFQEAYKFDNVIEDLPYMPIVSPLRDEFTASKRCEKEKKDTLRMMTYNILADLYVSREVEDGSEIYPHVKQEHIQKTRRIPMILAEILAHDSDVICLQEVDGAVFDCYLQPVFQAMGYDGYYSNKASCQREGCAMFWSREKFEVDEALTFSLRDLFDVDENLDDKEPTRTCMESNSNSSFQQWDSMRGINHLLGSHKELRKVTMEKIGQVLQIASLKLKNPNEGQPQKLVVANTHLFYHPMADHIRAMQVYVVCKKVDETRRRNADPGPYPFMLCGDLNSDPLSGAAQLLFIRYVQPDHHDCWKHLHEYQWDMGSTEYMVEHEYVGNSVGSSDFKYEEEDFKNAVEDVSALAKPSAPKIELPNSFPILVSGCEEMPKFTNFAVDFVDTLDYIIGSQASKSQVFGFSPKRSARMPTTEEVKQFVAMVRPFSILLFILSRARTRRLRVALAHKYLFDSIVAK